MRTTRWWGRLTSDGRLREIRAKREELVCLADDEEAVPVRVTLEGAPSRRGRIGRSRMAQEAISDRVRQAVLNRDGRRCIFCRSTRRLELHHVTKRSQGGPHVEDNLVTLCHDCHARTDWPYAKGRLVVRALGGGGFDARIEMAPDKWAARGANV